MRLSAWLGKLRRWPRLVDDKRQKSEQFAELTVSWIVDMRVPSDQQCVRRSSSDGQDTEDGGEFLQEDRLEHMF